MKKTALLVVDVQQGLVDTGPYRFSDVWSNISTLIDAFRNNGSEVVFVQHCEAEGELKPGTPTWNLFSEIHPLPGELIVHKRFNSAFKDTDLDDHFKSRGITDIVVVGMQTEYCIDATIKSGFERRYQIIVPEETNTTFDNDLLSAQVLLKHYMNYIWMWNFAEIEPLTETLKRLLDDDES